MISDDFSLLYSAMRQAYLQNGGNDPDVLSQLSHMQAEAQKIEDEMKNANYDNRHRGNRPNNWTIICSFWISCYTCVFKNWHAYIF